MKALAVSFVSAVLMASLLGTAMAQSGQPSSPEPSAPPTAKDSPPRVPASPENGRTEGLRPGATPAPGVNIDNRTEIKPESSGEGSASPRTTGETPTIIGLSPTAAVLLAAALLLVLIVAIVAMSRSGPGHIDIDTRPRV